MTDRAEPDHQAVYAAQGDEYEALIAREDWQGNLLAALEPLAPLAGRRVLDLGAGTGRLACLLAPRAASVRAFDVSAEMLRVCRRKLEASGLANWEVEVADHRALPVADHGADLAVSGWSVSYLATWNPGSWRAELEAWLREMRRALVPGGLVVLFESLGTGNEEPRPLPHLAQFTAWLGEAGFAGRWIRTDYRFASPEEAERLCRFFFGATLADRVRAQALTVVPECTGVWWKRV